MSKKEPLAVLTPAGIEAGHRAECPFCCVPLVKLETTLVFSPQATREHSTRRYDKECPKCSLLFEREEEPKHG